MNNADLNRQYDKLVDHLKTERDELLWYHNFFLGSNTIILGILLTQSVGSKFLSIFLFSLALAISTIWLFTIKKQMSWIDDWLKKIKIVEKKLEISYDICLYSHGEDTSKFLNFEKGKLKIWLSVTPWLFIASNILMLLITIFWPHLLF